jgi:hypothetical protein
MYLTQIALNRSKATPGGREGGGGVERDEPIIQLKRFIHFPLVVYTGLSDNNPQMDNIAIEALNTRLKVLDDEYEKNRKALVSAIKRLGGSEPVPKCPPRPAKLNGHGADLNLRIRSLSDAVRESFKHMPEHFTLDDVRTYVKDSFPHINTKTVGSRIWEACNEPNGPIVKVSPGRGGKANLYSRKKTMN